MEKLDWDKFKNGELAVNCKTEKAAREFIDECYKRGMKSEFSMNTSLILITIGLLGIFHFMSVITLKKKLESLQKGIDKQKEYWKVIEHGIEIQSDKILKKIDETVQENELVLENFEQYPKVIINSLEKLEGQIKHSTEEINKTTKEEAIRIMFTPLKVKYEK